MKRFLDFLDIGKHLRKDLMNTQNDIQENHIEVVCAILDNKDLDYEGFGKVIWAFFD